MDDPAVAMQPTSWWQVMLMLVLMCLCTHAWTSHIMSYWWHVQSMQASLMSTGKAINTQQACTVCWALAVFGHLDVAFLQAVLARINPSLEVNVSCKRLFLVRPRCLGWP